MRNNDDMRYELFAIDDAYPAFMDSMDNTVAHDFDEVNNYISNADYENSSKTLSSISDRSDFTKFAINADTIFLNSWAKGRYTLTDFEYYELLRYAEGDAMFYGPAVYTARVMLGLEGMNNDGARKPKPISNLLPQGKELIKVYPNPSSGVINIEFIGKLPNNLIVEVYSINAKLILRQNIINNPQKLELNGIGQGLYFYRVLSNGSILTNGKIVINR